MEQYRDLPELNWSRQVLDAVGSELLETIAEDYLTLLGTASAVHEASGAYAQELVTSGWCRVMHSASRQLAGTDDVEEAMASGVWHCYESCKRASREAVRTGSPADLECAGGLRTHAVPIVAGGDVVGSITFGYGDPPRDPARLRELAAKFETTVETLQETALRHAPLRPEVIEAAKRRLRWTADLIGGVVAAHEAMDRLRERAEELEAAVARDQEVVGIVSHDLRNPLSSVGLAASYLMEPGVADERKKATLDLISRNVEQMTRLVQDLHDLTRLRGGRFSIEAEAVDPGELVRAAVEASAPLADATRIALDIEFPPGLPPVQADRNRVLQVFGNLIGNALRFTPAGGRITVRARGEDDAVVFEVADTGPGIPEDALPHVFERFWQGPGGDHRGAGLGLTIARGIVEAHGGLIRAESLHGEGATFRFTLPRAPVGSASPAARVPTPAHAVDAPPPGRSAPGRFRPLRANGT